MRSFILSILATLAFALFSYAAPMPAGAAAVNAIAARGKNKTKDHGHTKEVSLEVVLTTAIKVITPIAEELSE
jgi:hypothetical protein